MIRRFLISVLGLIFHVDFQLIRSQARTQGELGGDALTDLLSIDVCHIF